MFLQIDGTFWVQLVNFALFFAILNAIFLRPVGRAIAQRRAHIDEVKNDLERYHQELSELRAQAEAKLAAARRDASERLTQGRSAASDEAASIGAEYTEQAASITEAARTAVAAELAAASSKEPALAQSLAADMLAKAMATGGRA